MWDQQKLQGLPNLPRFYTDQKIEALAFLTGLALKTVDLGIARRAEKGASWTQIWWTPYASHDYMSNAGYILNEE
ncbi:MAG: hypothetical protein AABN95_05830 [Acidobacteriota bacterium]